MTLKPPVFCLLAALSLAALPSGCYRTSISSGRPGDGAVHSDRQWFTLAGLVPLSKPAGRECRSALSRADSRLSFTDVLINFGLFTAGFVGGSLACRDGDSKEACAAAGSAIVPFLIGSRTVEYECAQGGDDVGLVPRARNQDSASAARTSSPR